VAIKTIPSQTIKTCDSCGVSITAQNGRQEGALHVKAHALDMQGFACADASRKIDLCDRCLYSVSSAIDAAMRAARLATPPDNAAGREGVKCCQCQEGQTCAYVQTDTGRACK